MVEYSVTVYTSDRAFADTYDYVYITLVGTDGESERIQLPSSLICGELQCTISCTTSIGELELIKLDKQKRNFLFEDSWFPDKVVIKSPENETFTFPAYRWITDSKVYSFREGTALTFQEDTNPCGRSARKNELREREKDYCWYSYKEGIPHSIKANNPNDLPPDVTFSWTKTFGFDFTAVASWLTGKFGELLVCKERWTGMDQITRVFNIRKTVIAEHVHRHWKNDDFFGYQFLNGVNPMVIRRCTALPDNFPVTDNMVFLDGQGSLAAEMKNGNIFLCDYKILDGIPTNVINGKEQYLMAPLVLLHKTKDKKMMPIAIQLKQQPGKDNPIFFPTDSEYDWLLAKIFVRSADFNFHELNTHLLRTHLLAEVFAVSLLRNVPMVHPLYKLLIPHTRYTLHINVLGREKLISPDGVFSQFAASGGEKEGMFTILKRSLSSLTYSSLCIPDDIAERGLEDVPDFYYKEDGIKLWGIIHRFVKGILGYYYEKDSDVENDPELQKWIGDIFEHGFLSQSSTGIPQKFTTVDELIKFVTMVIFTGSAQHAAVNSGQYDYGAWMPNTPITLQQPPPTKKGEATEETMLETFPDVNTTIRGMDTLFLLSKESADVVHLGQYPEEHFTEDIPCQRIEDFQGELEVLSATINVRNRKKKLQYEYLDPEKTLFKRSPSRDYILWQLKKHNLPQELLVIFYTAIVQSVLCSSITVLLGSSKKPGQDQTVTDSDTDSGVSKVSYQSQLLIPHTRYTMHINLLARQKLISPDGVFTKFTASGGEGMFTVLKRSLSALTYSSLCIPDDIANRGLEDVPNFYYRDDGLQLWEIIYKFVKGILNYYYKKDSEVQEDTEVQKWIGDIFEHGFLCKLSTGIPQRLSTVNEFIKFVTMVIFSVSAQHAAVNSGQVNLSTHTPMILIRICKDRPILNTIYECEDTVYDKLVYRTGGPLVLPLFQFTCYTAEFSNTSLAAIFINSESPIVGLITGEDNSVYRQ
ncbi:polyunsaturated fatty acid lipoxygenase ALOX15B-like [Anableps anableps]